MVSSFHSPCLLRPSHTSAIGFSPLIRFLTGISIIWSHQTYFLLFSLFNSCEKKNSSIEEEKKFPPMYGVPMPVDKSVCRVHLLTFISYTKAFGFLCGLHFGLWAYHENTSTWLRFVPLTTARFQFFLRSVLLIDQKLGSQSDLS